MFPIRFLEDNILETYLIFQCINIDMTQVVLFRSTSSSTSSILNDVTTPLIVRLFYVLNTRCFISASRYSKKFLAFPFHTNIIITNIQLINFKYAWFSCKAQYSLLFCCYWT